MNLKLGLKVHEADNVATIFAENVIKGIEVEIRDKSGSKQMLKVLKIGRAHV